MIYFPVVPYVIYSHPAHYNVLCYIKYDVSLDVILWIIFVTNIKFSVLRCNVGFINNNYCHYALFTPFANFIIGRFLEILNSIELLETYRNVGKTVSEGFKTQNTWMITQNHSISSE